METSNAPTGPRVKSSLSKKRLAIITLIGWFSMLGSDIFLHAGALASFYVEPGPFLLPPADAFLRIPLGYLSFLLSAFCVLWLMLRLQLLGWRVGLIFGLKLGAFFWSIQTIGLLSISTAPPLLLLGWFAGQTLELGIAGGVIGSGLNTASHFRLFLKVLAYVVGALVVTIVLQNVGMAPVIRP